MTLCTSCKWTMVHHLISHKWAPKCEMEKSSHDKKRIWEAGTHQDSSRGLYLEQYYPSIQLAQPSRKWNIHSWLTRFHTAKWTLADLQKSRWDMFKDFYGSNAKEMKSSDEQNDFVRYKESKIWIAQSHRVTREFWHHSVMHPSTLCSHIVNSLGLPASMH
jgi:hypothetical protein